MRPVARSRRTPCGLNEAHENASANQPCCVAAPKWLPGPTRDFRRTIIDGRWFVREGRAVIQPHSASVRKVLVADHCSDSCLIAQAVAGLSIGLVLVKPAGKVAWLNRAAEHVVGLAAGQCVGRPIGQVLKDPRLAAFWQDALSRDGNHMAEISLKWPRHLELKVNATHCTDVRGAPIGRALLFCDVTDERTVQVQMSHAVADRLLGLAGDGGLAGPLSNLTQQELRVFRLLGHGLGNEDIAAKVSISPSTVRSHLKSVYRKLALGSRAAAVRYAVRNHLA
jgi:DNA-binding CsgD family transcriptional regulator